MRAQSLPCHTSYSMPVFWLTHLIWEYLHTRAVPDAVKGMWCLACRCGKRLTRRRSHAMKLWSAG